ncbi:acyloxyacyl hydrolase [Sphingomonas sp. BN140010]|uniref:Acyloxyacyl hydrolase n=1 Tax=Sphingomonas arvum TaxID=2992113 RepID=A0ABT3JG29_9SPHN|nr:acyloxyacyl hydrolase [Sphingomonas sp. BN140010]MCW3798048.1 acyloxyacyl hydrolase [Sphingomonas sp. BN140010]
MNLALVPLAFLAATPADAGEVFAGVHRQAVNTPLSLSSSEESGVDLSLGYRFGGVGRTRLQPYVFGALNTKGDTSYAAAGLSYRFGDRLYVRPGVGVAIHNGSARNYEVPGNGKIEFGSRVLFEPELAIGLQATDRLGVEASWVHLSHAQLFGKQNPGIDNIGVRLNWRL